MAFFAAYNAPTGALLVEDGQPVIGTCEQVRAKRAHLVSGANRSAFAIREVCTITRAQLMQRLGAAVSAAKAAGLKPEHADALLGIGLLLDRFSVGSSCLPGGFECPLQAAGLWVADADEWPAMEAFYVSFDVSFPGNRALRYLVVG